MNHYVSHPKKKLKVRPCRLLGISFMTYALEGVTTIHELGSRVLKRYPDNTVVKSGAKILKDEGDAMILAAELDLPAPRLVDFNGTRQTVEGFGGFRMTYIEGQTLEEVWQDMLQDQKLDICQQLREIIEKMRTQESKTGVIGSVSGGILREPRYIDVFSGGPFKCEADFNRDFVLALFPKTPSAIQNGLAKTVLTNHRIVFSHGDLSPRNILVKDDKVTLIDWEYAGWLPEWWEYYKFFDQPTKHKDWVEYHEHIFPQTYEHELIMMQAIKRWQRY